MTRIVKVIFFVLGLTLTKGDPSVHLLSENFNQVITSTTLKWVPASRNGKIDFENAVIGAEQIMEGKISEFLINAGCLLCISFYSSLSPGSGFSYVPSNSS